MAREQSKFGRAELSGYVSKDLDTLLSLIKQGDQKAFAELYQRYFKKLNFFVQKRTKDFEDNNPDILQEVFFRVWINRDRLEEIHNFDAWIYKVVANECLALIRQELHHQTKKDRLEVLHKAEPSAASFSKHTDIAEIRGIIGAEIQRMSPQRKKIYMLSREKGYTPAQIAEELNISLPTVYNTISTALKQIRQALIAAGYEVHLLILALLNLF